MGMSVSFAQRLTVLREISKQTWIRFLSCVWFISGLWDLFLSEWIPEEYGKRLPRVYQVVAMTAGLASWTVWVLFGATIIVVGAVEWAYLHKKRYLELLHQGSITDASSRNRAPQSESSPISSETTGSLDPHWQFDSQMADAIAARLRSRPEWQGKIIVDVTPEYLWNLFRERTTRQGNKDAERFLNRWMVVCGPFGDVSRAVFTTVLMYFSKEWGDQLELIMPDKKIAVVGRIESVNSNTLQLEDCELVQ
jgi:hypothetical protein